VKPWKLIWVVSRFCSPQLEVQFFELAVFFCVCLMYWGLLFFLFHCLLLFVASVISSTIFVIQASFNSIQFDLKKYREVLILTNTNLVAAPLSLQKGFWYLDTSTDNFQMFLLRWSLNSRACKMECLSHCVMPNLLSNCSF
jgi:glucan phosphoethanolaminetransferase (alkaline phosphatase superfamily)